jgi:ATP-dependent helicase Lhr and Lhr-like helicase
MCELDQRVASAFYGGFSELRDSQKATIKPLLEGKNLVLAAGTGSGKTEAVMTPIISRVWREIVPIDDLAIIYTAPTKALVNDLEKRLGPPLGSLGLRIGVRHGDRDDLSSGKRPHVLVTTPESLDVLLFRNDPALITIRVIVIDEVHLLYNSQRGLQLSVLVERLRKVLSNGIQIVMLSATIGRLHHIAEFFLGADKVELLSFPSERSIDAYIQSITDLVDFQSLIKRLVDGRPTKLLVFADSRKECERLAGWFSRDKDFQGQIFSHYSSLSPEVRQEVEQKFSDSQTAICFATSTLELGIDIGDIDAVILWGIPGGVESFLQRIGRGNRRAKKSNVICLIPDHSESIIYDALRFTALIDAAKKGELPVRAPFELYGAAVQQILGVIASQKGRFTRIADLCTLFEHCSFLSRPILEEILGEIASKGYLQKHGFKNQYGAGEKLYPLVDHRLIYGNFGIGSQHIDVFYNAKHMGEVPSINLLRIHRGQYVRFAGGVWRVVEANSEKIKVEPGKGNQNAIDFKYPGTRMGWDSFLTTRLWRVFHDACPYEIFEPGLGDQVKAYLEFVKREWQKDSIPYIRTNDGLCYLTFAGHLTNKSIALAAGKFDFQAKDITLTVPSPIEWSSIPTNAEDYKPYFDQMFDADSEQTFYQSLLPPHIQRAEYAQMWLKDATILDTLKRLQAAKVHQIKSL